MKKQLVFLILILGYSLTIAQGRKVKLLENWKFTQYDHGAAFKEQFDTSKWQNIVLPHDWAAEGDFDFSNDVQLTMVVQDGESKPKYRTGRSGALPYTGVGWYRTHFTIKDISKVYELMFDGAMSHAKVYVNGNYVGARPNGYISFFFNISSFLKKGDNVLAVRLENFNRQSRWYPGAGLYRKVSLVQKEQNHVATWGTFVTTPKVSNKKAKIHAEINIKGVGEILLKNEIIDPKGDVVLVSERKINPKDTNTTLVDFDLKKPKLWNLSSPHLYQLKTSLFTKGKLTDEIITSFGIRKLNFETDGFYLNDKKIRFKGVNMHHDLGPTGAAFYPNLFERQLLKLKEMGVNAIRFSHNPPAPEALDLCDKYGFLAIDEAFDEWQIGKVKNGYSKHFDKWAKRDLVDMIYRDRNHPSIIMWSIGNEIMEQYQHDPNNITGYLNDIVKTVDTTRATTCGFNSAINALKSGMAAKVDVAGFNYKPGSYHLYRQKYPNLKFYASETGGTVSLRDTYRFPVVFDTLRNAKGLSTHTHVFKDGYPGNYETTNVRWGYSPFKEFASQDYNPFVYGEFVWTGYDYLGEPSPYHDAKSRSSYFAPIDFVGLVKDKFYLYKERWNKTEKVLHAFPHWSDPANKGTVFPVVCYTNYDKAELFVNGVSKGIKTKEKVRPASFLNNSFETHGSGGASFELMKNFAIVWDDITYTPGEIKIVAYNKKGKKKETLCYKTAKKASKIKIEPEVKTIKKGEVAVYVITVTDSKGNWQPNYNKLLSIEVTGAGKFLASGNGDPTNMQKLSSPKRYFYKGKIVVFVKAVKTGAINIKVGTENFTQTNKTIVVKQ